MADVIELKNYDILFNNETEKNNPEINVSCSLSYEEFFQKFLIANRPCLFESDITKEWRCRRDWNIGGAPNFKILLELFGNCVAPVADCKTKYYNSQLKDDTKVENFLNYWMEYRNQNYPDDMPIHYLKDWHCVRKYSELRLYEVPKYFASDWLNEYYIAHEELQDDYMFVYMGPKGTWTPLHADVFTSYSWSANIVGRKKWLLFPPGEENALRNSFGQLSFDATSEELKNHKEYPNYNEETLKSYEIIQEEGEIIFIPSGWHHQVWNLDDCISINHNWINGCNVSNFWLSLRKELSAVMREVEDCRDMDDWEKHCQLMLKASHGMNYTDFFKLVSFVVERRLKILENRDVPLSFEKWKIGPEHCFFDLNQIKTVLIAMTNDTKDKEIYELIFPDNEIYNILDDINRVISLRSK